MNHIPSVGPTFLSEIHACIQRWIEHFKDDGEGAMKILKKVKDKNLNVGIFPVDQWFYGKIRGYKN
jgi:hypothetical protein